MHERRVTLENKILINTNHVLILYRYTYGLFVFVRTAFLSDDRFTTEHCREITSSICNEE